MSNLTTRIMAAVGMTVAVTTYGLHIHDGMKQAERRAADLRLIELTADELLHERRDRFADYNATTRILDRQAEQIRVLNALVAHMPTRPGSPFPHVTVDRSDDSKIPPQELPTKPKD